MDVDTDQIESSNLFSNVLVQLFGEFLQDARTKFPDFSDEKTGDRSFYGYCLMVEDFCDRFRMTKDEREEIYGYADIDEVMVNLGHEWFDKTYGKPLA